MKLWFSPQYCIKLGVVACTHDPYIKDMEAEGSEVQGYPQLGGSSKPAWAMGDPVSKKKKSQARPLWTVATPFTRLAECVECWIPTASPTLGVVNLVHRLLNGVTEPSLIQGMQVQKGSLHMEVTCHRWLWGSQVCVGYL